MAQIERKGDLLVITVNVSESSLKNATPSSTGKMLLIDTFSDKVGNIRLQGNVMVKNPAYVDAAKVEKGRKSA